MILSLLLPTQVYHNLLGSLESDRPISSAKPEGKELSQPFLEMLGKHRRLLYQVIRSYGSSQSEWRDLEQEIILQLWQSYPNFDSTYKYSTWIYRIAFNVAATHFRLSRKRSKQERESAAIFTLSTKDDDPEVTERRQALYAAIRKLGPADRPIVMLHLEGLSYQVIAEIVGISPSNVGTRLNRIRAKLKKSLNPKNPT